MRSDIRSSLFVFSIAALATLVALGCGDGGGSPMPDGGLLPDGGGPPPPPPGEVAGCVMGGSAALDTLGCPDPFVDAHNQWRQDVNAGNLAGQPAPMTPLTNVSWDPVLAQVAADYASLCVWEHNADRTADYQALGGLQGYVGENLYAQWGSTPTAADALDSWGGEYVDYDYAGNSCAPNKACGHYTQVVWDDSVEVGCAMVLCPEVEFDSGTRTDVWITLCNYAPGGNYDGVRPY